MNNNNTKTKKTSLVERELVKEQVVTEKKQTVPDVIRNVQKLLEDGQIQDRQMLKNLGMDTHLQIADGMVGKRIDLEKHRQEFAGEVYHKDTIRSLAVNYRLRFLKTHFYKGVVDVEIPAKIREFSKKSGFDVTDAHLHQNFFILAPDNAFNKQGIEIPKKIINRDPMLFFKIDDNHYRLIHKWGNDFSILRAILGWKWKSQGNFFLFGFLIALVCATLLASAVLPLSFIGSLAFWGIVAVVGLIGGFVHYSSNVKNNDFLSQNLTPNCWNNDQVHF